MQLLLCWNLIRKYFAAKKDFKKKSRYNDNRLSKREFRTLVHSVVDTMEGTDNFDGFVDFLINSVEVSEFYFYSLMTIAII